MNINITTVNDNIIVKEIYDDIKVNGILTAYDEDSPYMFCEVVDFSLASAGTLGINKGDVLVIKRYAKEEFITGLYFISWKDVRCVISKESFEKLLDEGVSF